MNKKMLYSAFVFFVIFFCINNLSAYAFFDEVRSSQNVFRSKPVSPDFTRGKHHPRLSEEEMKAKKAEFEKRLNLSEEQKKQIEENRIRDREKIKPVMQKIHQNKFELRNIQKDNSLSDVEKQQKEDAIKKDIRILETQADKYRLENMKNFENILTDEQKAEFEKIKTEQKLKMQERRRQFDMAKQQNQPQKPEIWNK